MIRIGRNTIIDARGRVRDFDDHRTRPSVTSRFYDRTYAIRIDATPPNAPLVSFEFSYDHRPP